MEHLLPEVLLLLSKRRGHLADLSPMPVNYSPRMKGGWLKG
jgi:hypothetical protein